MDQWNSHTQGGGGYFNEENQPASESKKPAARQQFLCPVTVKQILEAPEEGLKVGQFTATMVTILGVVTGVEVSSTNIKFSISDDTGIIDCLDWIESEDTIASKKTNIMEGVYYQVFGTIKSPQGRRRVMVFKFKEIEDFNEVSSFMAEVLSVANYAKKLNQNGYIPTPMDTTPSTVATVQNEYKAAFSPVQRAVLEAIKMVNSQIGWSKDDPVLRSKFPPKAIEDALEFLIGEGHIYSTVDDDHYCCTA